MATHNVGSGEVVHFYCHVSILVMFTTHDWEWFSTNSDGGDPGDGL